jgi:hypothetical protein
MFLFYRKETSHPDRPAPVEKPEQAQPGVTRNCIRAIARYSVVKELNQAVLAAGPPQGGANKLLKSGVDVN